MKFGGTSVGSPERMKGVASLVTESGEPTFIVLSAMSGTTNSLVEISDYLYKKNPEGANEVINNLEKKYMQHVEDLYSTEEMKKTTREFLQGEFNYLRSFTKDLFTPKAGIRAKNQGRNASNRMKTTLGNAEKSMVVKSTRTDNLWKNPICNPTSARTSNNEGTHHKMASSKGHSLTPMCQSQKSGRNARTDMTTI